MEDNNFDIIKFINTDDVDSFIAKELSIDDDLVPNSSSSSSVSNHSEDTTDLTVLCLVCEAKAGRHSYYGAKVCLGCRAFFRRSVMSQQQFEFKCLDGSNQCQVQAGETRRSCKRCRFYKCLQSGMVPSLVMTERDNKVRMMKRKAKLCVPTDNMTKKLANILTLEEQDFYKKTCRQFFDFTHAQYYILFDNNMDLFHCFFDASLDKDGRAFPDNRFEACLRYDKHLVRNYAFGLSEMSTLSPSDRMQLIMKNFGKIAALWSCACLTKGDLLRHTRDFLNFGLNQKTKSDPVARLLKNVDWKSLEECEVIFVNVKDKDDELPYFIDSSFRSIIQMVIRCFKAPDSKALDFGVFGLLLILALFDPGTLELENRKQVEDIQHNFAWALLKYLKTLYSSKASSYYHNALMSLVLAENLSDLLIKSMRKRFKEKGVRQIPVN